MWLSETEKRRRREEAASFARRFGANLASARRAHGLLCQEELSDLAALHRTTVGALERGERIPRADTLLKLAIVLGVDANALLEGITWTPPCLERGRFGIEEDGGEGPASEVEQKRAGHADLMERAAALRARQAEAVDAAALAREARGELEQRGS